MIQSKCQFCGHVNPTGAKFCNDCGAPLQVKPCSRCEAVNDQTAKSCYKCGTEFPAPAAGAPPTSSAPDVTAASPALGDPPPFRLPFGVDFDPWELPKRALSAELGTARAHASSPSEPAVATANSPAPQVAWPAAAMERDKLDLAIDRQRSTFDDSTPSVVVGSDRGHTPEPRSAAGTQDVPLRRPSSEMTGARESGPEIVTREPRSLGVAVTSPFTVAQRATAKVPLHNLEATAEPRPSSRVALAVGLSTVAFIAMGVLAYYIYSSMGPDEREVAQAVSAAPADVNAGSPPTRPIPKIGETASSASSLSLGTGSVAAIPARPVEPSTPRTISPVGQSTVAPTGSSGAAGQTPSTSEPHRQFSTSVRVSPSEELAAKADEVVKKPSAATTNAGNLRDRTMPATGSEVTAKPSTPNRPLRTYSAATASGSVQPSLIDGRATVRPDAPRPGPCTEGVAALGLCRLNSEGENK